MNTAEFLSHLNELEIKVWVEGEQLHCKGKKNNLTASLQTEIKSRKPELLTFLQTIQGKNKRKGPQLQKVQRNRFLPLSFAQQRLWFLHQLEPTSTRYHSPLTVRIHGALDVPALQRSLQIIVDRHESLRTSFPTHEGVPLQNIASELTVPWSFEDVRGRPNAEREQAMRNIVENELGRPFDLANGPIFRALLVCMNDTEYVLVLAMHHIISDGWSLGVLSQELEISYPACVEGRLPSLPELSIQYADYAVWQREWLQGNVLEEQLSYWRKQLRGITHLSLPTDFVRPAVQSYCGGQEHVALSFELSQNLTSLSRKHGVTLTILFLTALKVLLAKYSGQTDIAVGSPIANRTCPEVEGLIGFFVNILVLRTNLSGNPSLGELLKRVKRTSLGAYDHQDLPFERIVEELQPERDPSRNPFFQVLFAVQNVPFEGLRNPGLGIQPFHPWNPTTRFDLECVVWERSEGFLVNLVYNQDLFEAGTIKRFGQHFQRVLEEVVNNTDQYVSQISLMNEAEHQAIQDLSAIEDAIYSPYRCIHYLIEQQVESTPDAIALVFGERQLTYSELNTRANQLAQYLRRQGVGPEVRVGVCLERGIDYVVSVLAILKAGGAYVPMDPTAPSERVAFLVQDAAVELLLTQACHSAVWEPLEGVPILLLDEAWPQVALESAAPLAGVHTSAALAYIMYTSGSTGQPKGTLISQQSVVRLVQATNYIQLGAHDRVANLAHVAFDAITFEVWGPLLNGGVVVVFEQETVLTPARFAARLQEEGVSALFMTTALFNQVVREEPCALASIETVLFGGELVDRAWVARVLEGDPPGQLEHVYGPTESTTFATWHRVVAADLKGVTVPIGRPVSNTQAYVVDSGQHLVPVGVAGELLIGGDGVAWGYLNQPTLTAEKFIPHPYSTEPGARVYRTGDQVRWNRQGALEFQGRRDGQVKVRGHRIEVGEIEVTLREHAAVQDAVVLCREDQPGEKELVAYVVTTEEEDIPILRAHLKQQLPGYMVPSVVIRLEGLPLTANGKVDKRALPAPEGTDRMQGITYVAPSNSIHRLITDIWEEVLQLDQVGIHNNFFDLGGHSLLLVKVQMALQERLGHPVSMMDCFRYPTISKLANFLQTKHQISTTASKKRSQTKKLDKRIERMKRLSGRKKPTDNK